MVIIHHHHHHHVVLVARISLTLSRHSSLSFIALGRSSGQHPVSSHSCWMYVRAGRPAFARPCVVVHKSTSLMSSSLLLQQCPACHPFWLHDVDLETVKSWHILFQRKPFYKILLEVYIFISDTVILDNICYNSKVGDLSRGRPEGSLFNSYYTEV